MIFAMSMNTVSLAAERYHAETRRGVTYAEARQVALRSALIPQINSLFAVGLVSFPGIMTGNESCGRAWHDLVMNGSIEAIPLSNLALSLVSVAVVLVVLRR